jgi:hypothetical protein
MQSLAAGVEGVKRDGAAWSLCPKANYIATQSPPFATTPAQNCAALSRDAAGTRTR